MATKAVTQDAAPNGRAIFTWVAITESDDGAPILCPAGVATVQATGDFTTAGAMSIEGSNDATNWAPLKDKNSGSVISLTAATQVATLGDQPLYVRPKPTAGSAVAMVVTLTVG